MGQHYYGTMSALGWMLGHYFYDRKHHTWLANCFFPYNQGNPKSSNPLLIYQDLYQPWKDQDENDKFILSHRMNLVKGIKSKESERLVSAEESLALREICDKIDLMFFYPMVCRVDIDVIAPDRRTVANSGLRGSSEYLVADLAEDEFEVLFLDFEEDGDFKQIIKSAVSKDGYLDRYEVLDLLESRKNAGA